MSKFLAKCESDSMCYKSSTECIDTSSKPCRCMPSVKLKGFIWGQHGLHDASMHPQQRNNISDKQLIHLC